MLTTSSLFPLLLLAQAAPEVAPQPPPPAQQTASGEEAAPPEIDDGVLEGRRRPGRQRGLPDAVTQSNPGAVRAPPPEAFPQDPNVPVPDRWRIARALCPAPGAPETVFLVYPNIRNVCHSALDPYHQNLLKGDLPLAEGKRPGFLKGDDWFFSVSAISDTVLEPRTFPIPVGVQTTSRPQSLGVFGHDASFVFSQTAIVNLGLTKGNTAFKPPHIEYRLALAFNYNYVNVPERRVLNVAPSHPSHRSDHFLGVQEAFVDYHLRNTSERYDFDSIRVGIQPFQADFRGFLFNDQQLGIRLFGNRDNNRFQYNIAAFWRLEKDTNSGLNSVIESPRDDWLFIANVYRQDFLIPALTSQLTFAWNRNREGNDVHIDKNGFPVRPALLGTLRGRDYDAFYLGYNADGHIGRINLTASTYGLFGRDTNFFTGQRSKIRAGFAAAEASYDKDWTRFRLSALYASGDSNPRNRTETGFDAVFENPVFAGADTSYWIRQSIPFAGGGRAISVNGRNGILNSLRSSKDEGQSNFINPGTVMVGAGADFDLLPELRVSANANHLWFATTRVIEELRNEGSIPKNIGWDLSASAIWRPRATQNYVFRLSAATLLPGAGFKDLFDNSQRHNRYYSILANVVLAY